MSCTPKSVFDSVTYNTTMICAKCNGKLQYEIASLYDCKLVRVVPCEKCILKAQDDGREAVRGTREDFD